MRQVEGVADPAPPVLGLHVEVLEIDAALGEDRGVVVEVEREADRVAAVYAVLAALWIFFSDHLLYAVVNDASEVEHLAIAKGIVFVVATASLLYWGVRRELRRRAAAEEATRRAAAPFTLIYRSLLSS